MATLAPETLGSEPLAIETLQLKTSAEDVFEVRLAGSLQNPNTTSGSPNPQHADVLRLHC